jgi:hypothetical protein
MKQKYSEKLQELISNNKELKDIIEWFVVENNIDISKITLKEVKELIETIKAEPELDDEKFKTLIDKMK